MARAPRTTRLLAGALACLASALPAAAQRADAAPYSSFRAVDPVPPFRWVERGGREVTLDDLLGQPWIAVPFFKGCTGPCPSLTSDLRAVFEERLRGAGVRVVSFTLDPEVDTPEALREYADLYSLEGDQWLFLTGDDRAAMHAFVRDGLKVPVAHSDEAAVEYGASITHGTKLPVVDPEGRIAGWYEAARGTFGGDSAAFEASLEALVSRALALRPASRLPLVNAVLNGLAFVLLLMGLRAIRAGDREGHALWMRSAFVVSAAFLVCYLYYHLVVQAAAGPTTFRGAGAAKLAYLAMLASHVVLAIVNLPMVLRTLWLAQRGDWERHRWWARRTFPIWLYVSITGVGVYVVLYHLNPTP